MKHIIPILFLLLLIGCPKPDEKLDPAICEDGYHPCGYESQECCLDTSSHSFSYQTYSFGQYGSYFHDVFVINENDIWAVGKVIIEDPDSSYNGTGEELFNAAHWDGLNWELLRAVRPGGHARELNAVYAFNSNDVWFGEGGLPLHWDGEQFYMFSPLLDEHPGQPSIYAIWGPSASEVYFVGRGGSITTYDGSRFTELYSGTSENLIDISGAIDGSSTYCIGIGNSLGIPSVILQQQGNSWTTIYSTEEYLPQDNDYGYPLNVAIRDDIAYFSTMAGLWKYNIDTEESIFVSREDYSPIRWFHTHGMVVRSPVRRQTNSVHLI